MLGFVGRRLLEALPTLFVVSLTMFIILHLAPGDPVQMMLGEDADPQAVAALSAELGLDRPLPVQYVDWLIAAARGDLGRSIRTHERVATAILERLPVTLELSLFALVIAVAIGVPLGILAAVRRNSLIDIVSTTIALIGVSLPTFFTGLIFIFFFALVLRVLPPAGYTPFWQNPIENLRMMVMPSVALGAALAGILARMTRSSMLEHLGDDYIRTARAKGLSERAVIVRHALKNALIPVVTVLGLEMGALLGGAILIESIFALPGIGRLVIDSIFARDFPVVQGTILFLALTRMATNLLADVVYGWLDPRIAYA